MKIKIFYVLAVILCLFFCFSLPVLAATEEQLDKKYYYIYHSYVDNFTGIKYPYYCIVEKSDGTATVYLNEKQDYTGHCAYFNFPDADAALRWIEIGENGVSGFTTTHMPIDKGNLIAGNIDGYTLRPNFADQRTVLGGLFVKEDYNSGYFVSGILKDITSVIPVLIAFFVSFLTIDKAVRFIRGVVHNA